MLTLYPKIVQLLKFYFWSVLFVVTCWKVRAKVLRQFLDSLFLEKIAPSPRNKMDGLNLLYVTFFKMLNMGKERIPCIKYKLLPFSLNGGNHACLVLSEFKWYWVRLHVVGVCHLRKLSTYVSLWKLNTVDRRGQHPLSVDNVCPT